AFMGGVFSSIMPEMKGTLIQAMTVMGVSMGALIGLPPSLVETYGSDVKKIYKANGVPLYLGLVSMFISTFVHLMIMSAIIFLIAPIAFDAALPADLPLYFISLAVFIAVSVGVGCVLGLAMKKQSSLTMISQIIFLPSIMLSGIMFPIDMLPTAFEAVGKIFPASWGYKLMLNDGFRLENLWVLIVILIACVLANVLLLKKHNQ
ncbi:MAG: ABC transporter permease, partial [Christensenellaceae bacterium]